MAPETAVEERVAAAAASVGATWPLHSFVTANPLAGFEDRPFHEAVAEGGRLLGGDGYPSAAVFRRAWAAGRVDPERIRDELAAHGYDADPEATLDRMAEATSDDTEGPPETETATATAADRVDGVLSKWLSAFLDEGRAAWPMPNRDRGFYAAFRTVARHDGEIPDDGTVAALPDDPADAIRAHLADCPVDRRTDVVEHHLAALSGWTGLVKRRAADDGAWQSAYPISLSGYLAVRLTLVDLFGATLVPDDPADSRDDDRTGEPPRPTDDRVPLPEVWLRAWEASYRAALVDPLTEASESLKRETERDRPDAQLVFCIDTRSEVVRRHLEATGDYETHGYAGFFGVPTRYDGYGDEVTVDACPPILDARHRVAEEPTGRDGRDEHDRWRAAVDAGRTTVERLRSNAATAFSFVESAGVGYGAALAARTLVPARVGDLLGAVDRRVPDSHEFCAPALDGGDADGDLPAGLTHEERVEYAATAFDLIGWKRFSRVVALVGHAGETTNNPFDASLDCGACAGNPGGPSARVLAAICNDEAVRASLRERGVEIPEDTVFVAGEHTTTTDEVELYAADVPESHAADLERLRADLAAAREGAAAERVGDGSTDVEAGVREAERRAADWAETRPEWGLAGNAGFVVGPRELTDGLDLDGRVFLHSYDWQTDPDGDALAAIVGGPVVVTQWISAQYYFATVDNATYGSGSKVTHNPVGNVGVYQGNGGDLTTGLPHQSVASAAGEPHHQPLRLSTVVHAPVERVTEVLGDEEAVAELLDNGWLSLTVVDPTRDHRAFDYDGGLEWAPAPGEATTPTPAVDD